MTILDSGTFVLSWEGGEAQIVNFTTNAGTAGHSTVKVEIRVADGFAFSRILHSLHDARQCQAPLRRGKACAKGQANG